jgi:hypothetical protein
LATNISSLAEYDTFRNRNSSVEMSLKLSKIKLLELDKKLTNIIENEDLSQNVSVSFLTGGEDVTFQSTLARELSFCIHHSYHHCHTMKVIASNNGFGDSCPSNFGIAPSTEEHIRQEKA